MRPLAVALVLLLSACTTLRPLEDFSPTALREQVHEGDRIRIVTLKGATYEMEVTKVEQDRLHGVTDGGKRFYVDFEVIRSIEVERAQGWKIVTGLGATLTTLAVLTVMAVVYALSTL